MTITAKYAGICRKCRQRINVGDEIEWESGRGASHTNCPEKSVANNANTDNLIKISKGQGYGGREYSIGQVLRNPGNKEQILYVVKASKQYYREDGMSFGVGDEQGYIYYASCRLATDEEAVPLLAKENEIKAKKELESLRDKIAKYIRENGEMPEGRDNIPDGKILSDRQTIYGTGDWFVIGDQYIWYVENNGHDGDDWSRNNVRTGGAGAIGWRITRNLAAVFSVAGMTEELQKINDNLPHN